MPASPEQRARKERDREAAILLRRGGMSAAAVGEQLGRSARSIRDLCQGADLEAPLPAPDSDARKPGPKKPKRRRAPRQFKDRNQDRGRLLVDPDPLANVQPGDSVVVPDPRHPGQTRVLVKTKPRDTGHGYVGGLPTSARFTLP